MSLGCLSATGSVRLLLHEFEGWPTLETRWKILERKLDESSRANKDSLGLFVWIVWENLRLFASETLKACSLLSAQCSRPYCEKQEEEEGVRRMCVSSAGRVMGMPEQGETDEWVDRSAALLSSSLGFPIMPLHGSLYRHRGAARYLVWLLTVT